jgi:hypothetical protein
MALALDVQHPITSQPNLNAKSACLFMAKCNDITLVFINLER